MKKVLLTTAAAAVLTAIPAAAIGAAYGLYRYICYSDPKKHARGEDYLQSEYLGLHGDLLFPKLRSLLERPCEPVEVRSDDGLVLKGRFYAGEKKDRFVIFMHGYRAHAFGDFCGIHSVFDEMGWNMLIIDERACGDSEGTTITFGVKERLDCRAWAEYLTNRFGRNIAIVLFGTSMGAATVMMASNLELPESVKAVIADCGFTSPQEIIMNTAKKQGFPDRLCWPFARMGLRLFGKFDPMESSARESVAQTALPVLIIHGTEDHFVPYEMSKELKKFGGSRVQVYSVPDAGHVQSYQFDPEGYAKTVRDFLSMAMGE